MRKNFLTGLILLLPAILTLIILGFVVNLLTDPFVNILQGTLNFNISLHNNSALLLLIRIFIMIAIFFFTIFVGYITQTFFTYSFIRLVDELFKRIPIINTIYKSIKDVIDTLFSAKGSSFKQVVLVPYPNETSLSVGFITSTNDISTDDDPRLKDRIPVFVAGAPNPTVGFILIYPKDQVIYINMKVEEAFKLLVSCGIMMPATLGTSHEQAP
jgi:uncharacterized membrane protein